MLLPQRTTALRAAVSVSACQRQSVFCCAAGIVSERLVLLSARLPQRLAALPDNILRCPPAENTLTASGAPVSLGCCTLWLLESKAVEEFARLIELRIHLISVGSDVRTRRRPSWVFFFFFT